VNIHTYSVLICRVIYKLHMTYIMIYRFKLYQLYRKFHFKRFKNKHYISFYVNQATSTSSD